MKFGKEFRIHLEKTLPEWRDKFLCYKLLKKLLKHYPASVAVNLPPDAHGSSQLPPSPAFQVWFVAILYEELEKFNDFYVEKEEEFIIRFQALKERIERVKKRAKYEGMFTSETEFSEDMMEIRKDFVAIHGEMVLLKSYSSLNFAGILKLVGGVLVIDGSKRYIARLVVKGFQQKERIDYTGIFSPVVKLNTIRSVLSIVASEDLHLEQLDVKTAFLHGDLNEEIYISQPEGFVAKGMEDKVCKLNKSLYGLKQAPRQWYKKFDSFMHKEGFQKCNADHYCYFKRCESSYIILLLYVDDILVVGSDMGEIRKLKQQWCTGCSD